jgi:hypothetical protein
MQLTMFILLLPVLAFLGALPVFQAAPVLSEVCFFTWPLSSVVCLVWGFFISRRSGCGHIGK